MGLMGQSYGIRAFRVPTTAISTINLTNTTLTASSDSPSGSGTWDFSHANMACGSTGCNLIIDDNAIPFTWTHISWNTYLAVTSSCWDFAQNNSGYGNGTHNIQTFSTANGDAVSKPKNCFELVQYAVKMQACDNNADNFNHGSYATGSFRYWNMRRRRNGTLAAGPAIGLACTGGGTSRISEIFVWAE